MAGKIKKSGEIVKISGQYEIVGPRGGHTGREVTVTKDEPFPPTPQPAQGFVLVNKTKHKKN